MPQIAQSLTVDSQSMAEGPITANGKYHAFRSGDISTTNNKAVDATVQVTEFLPNRQNLGRAKLMFVMERKDDAGNWHPVHGLFSTVDAISYGPSENGGIIPDQQLSYGPSVFNFDGAVSIDTSDGESIILQDHQKRGVLPDTIRFCVIVHERDFGNPGAFDRVTFSVDYEIRAD